MRLHPRRSIPRLLNPARSLTAHNASASEHALATAARWWFVGFPLVIACFMFLFRLYRGKVKSPADGSG
jgi:cytochrome bd-type quinol oxidase subunit 2